MPDLNQLLKESPKPDSHWKGPRVDGITQSKISEYILCNERSRLRLIEGLSVPQTFSPPLHYGQMFHVCEEFPNSWEAQLNAYVANLAIEFPEKKDDIWKWWQVCKIQYPIYLEYWKRDDVNREIILNEHSFWVPYKLPSGRWFVLRGKWDAIILLHNVLYLQENKTKSDIDREKIQKRLAFDLQTMLYLVAIEASQRPGKILGKFNGKKLRGVYYNVIRRPLSGGKGTIRRHKGSKKVPEETWEHYLGRLKNEVLIPDCASYYDRFTVDIDGADIPTFKHQFLNPVLENMYDDYVWWWYCHRYTKDHYDYSLREKLFPLHQKRNFRFPYGIYSNLVEGRGLGTDLDYLLDTGNDVGLVRNSPLFPEL
jgi:hypothetical protein